MFLIIRQNYWSVAFILTYKLEPRQFKNNLTMFESKLILKIAADISHLF